jgi:plasmid stabilization system protein ParE
MASCTVWVAASADATVQRISRWWAKNRPAAPRLFEFELARAIEMIEAHPEIGRWARHPLHGRVQVLLLRRTEVHVFLQVLPDSQRGWDRVPPSRASPAAPEALRSMCPDDGRTQSTPHGSRTAATLKAPEINLGGIFPRSHQGRRARSQRRTHPTDQRDRSRLTALLAKLGVPPPPKLHAVTAAPATA